MADLSASLPNVIDLGSDSSSTGCGSELSAQAGRHDDNSFHAADFPSGFLTALDSIWAKNLGTFAYSAPINAKVFKDPRINVDGVGRIPLPLSVEHAQKIVALSEKGILKPNAFRIENPLWEQRVLHVLVDKAAKQLAVACKLDSIGAQLREMQLCNSDTAIEAPPSTDVTDGAIGTLVVCLPSPHQGGDVHVTLASSVENVLKSSELQPSFMCWHHEMKSEARVVSSGYRWTLVYDIKDIEQPRFNYSSSALSTQMMTLHKNFEIWKHAYNKLAPLYIYVLEKDVDKNMLSLDVLSGKDLALARVLKEVGHKLGFDIFLARIESTKRGSVLAEEHEYDLVNDSLEYQELRDFRKMKESLERGYFREVEDSHEMEDFHTMEDVHAEDVTLKSIFDLSGRLLVTNVEVNEEEVLQEDWEENFDAEETDLKCDGFGDSFTATHVFRGTALVMMSYQEAIGFLAGQGCSPNTLFDHLRQQQVDDAGYLKSFQDELLRSSAAIKLHGDESGKLESIIEACISLKDTSLFCAVALPPERPLSSQALSSLSSWIREVGFEPLEAGLEKLIPDEAVVFETHNFLQSLLSCQAPEHPQLASGVESDLLSFAERKTNAVLDKASQLYMKDVIALVDMLKTTRHFEQTAEKVEQAVRRHAQNTPVLLHFLGQVLSMPGGKHNSFILERFPRIFADMTAHFSLRHDVEELNKAFPGQKPKKYPHDYSYPRTQQRSNFSLWTPSPESRLVPDSDWHLLSRVTAQALELRLEDKVSPIFQKLLTECHRVNNREAERMLLPFMNFLPQKMAGDGLKTLAEFPRVRAFYRAFVTSYFNRAVGKEPMADWSCEPATVGTRLVQHFRHLNTFLQSSQYIEGRFRVSEYCQKQLMQAVPSKADCTFRTDQQGCLIIRKRKNMWESTRRAWADACKSFVLDVKKLGDFVDLEAVLGEIYGRVVLYQEQRAKENPIVVGANADEQVPPYKRYEWNGTRPTQAARTRMPGGVPSTAPVASNSASRRLGTQLQRFALSQSAGTSQTSGPLSPIAANTLPRATAPVAKAKRKAGGDTVKTDKRGKSARRKK